MRTRIGPAAGLACLCFSSGCGERGDDASQDIRADDPASLEEEWVTAHDLNDFDQDGDALLNDSEWRAYSEEHLVLERWDGDASGALDREEFERATGERPAADDSFDAWDRDASGRVDITEFGLRDANRDGVIAGEELQ